MIAHPIKATLLSLILTVLHGSQAYSQTSNSFTATGPMITPGRTGHTATLLFNGKVLIAGGYSGLPEESFALAELYDPSTGTFRPAGPMTRSGATATLLPNGRVLIIGGFPTADIYDPISGTFSVTAEMVSQVYPGRGVAVLLRNGKVFIAGYPTAQLYDPVTDTFAPTSSYAGPLPAVLGSVTLLTDGRVLLTGAVNICYQLLCREPGTPWAEIYDPVSHTFSLAGRMNWWNTVDTATLLPGGKVLFVGNDTYNGIASVAEVFDPSDATFTALDPPPASHGYGAVTLLPDGKALITGGLMPGGKAQSLVEFYGSSNATFSPVGNMSAPRVMHTATLLQDGTVLLAGGLDSVAPSAELYHPTVPIPAPKLFSVPESDESAQGQIWHATTGRLVSRAAPARPGEVLSLYTTDLDAASAIPPQVAIGGLSSEVQFFGEAPGYPGFYQI